VATTSAVRAQISRGSRPGPAPVAMKSLSGQRPVSIPQSKTLQGPRHGRPEEPEMAEILALAVGRIMSVRSGARSMYVAGLIGSDAWTIR